MTILVRTFGPHNVGFTRTTHKHTIPLCLFPPHTQLYTPQPYETIKLTSHNSADSLLLTCTRVLIADSCQSVLKHRHPSSLHGGVNLLLLPHTGELCTCTHTSWTASLRQHRKQTNEWRLSDFSTLYIATLLETFDFCKASLLLKVVSTSSTAYFFWNKSMCLYKGVLGGWFCFNTDKVLHQTRVMWSKFASQANFPCFTVSVFISSILYFPPVVCFGSN